MGLGKGKFNIFLFFKLAYRYVDIDCIVFIVCMYVIYIYVCMYVSV